MWYVLLIMGSFSIFQLPVRCPAGGVSVGGDSSTFLPRGGRSAVCRISLSQLGVLLQLRKTFYACLSASGLDCR